MLIGFKSGFEKANELPVTHCETLLRASNRHASSTPFCSTWPFGCCPACRPCLATVIASGERRRHRRPSHFDKTMTPGRLLCDDLDLQRSALDVLRSSTATHLPPTLSINFYRVSADSRPPFRLWPLASTLPAARTQAGHRTGPAPRQGEHLPNDSPIPSIFLETHPGISLSALNVE